MQRVAPDSAALEVAHRLLRTPLTLAEAQKIPSLRIVLEIVARRHMQRRARVDVKKLQANDND
ncbi:MAG: hypothetical protein M3Y65_20670 [Pseudomonadota bacterium]|nr:hypothetical protein [Pseudomonadota bacterium]